MRIGVVSRFAAVTAVVSSSLLQGLQGQILDENMGCQLVALLPFSDLRDGPPEEINTEGLDYYGYGVWPDKETLEKASFSLMAAAEMAVEHFNNRDTSVVPELEELVGNCNVYFPPVYYRDSAYSRPASVDALVEITRNSTTPDRSMCAVVGPTHPRANEGVSSITENLWIPQFAYSTIDRRLSRRDDFPTLARTITSSQDYGFAIANFVQRDVLKREYLAIIYDVSDYGEQYEDPLEDAEDFFEDYATITEHIIESNPETIYDSLGTTVEDGFHSILLATDRIAVLDDVAEIAEELGLLGEEYFWMVSGDMLTPDALPHIKYEVDSPADKLLRGAAVFTNYDPFIYYGETDPFLQAWRQQSDKIAENINTNNPVGKPIIDDTIGYFQNNDPTEYASFLYDSIMLTGISACAALTSTQEGQNVSHVDQVFETRFQGASGFVEFSESETSSELVKGKLNGRDISGATFGMYNVRPRPVDENGMRGYELVLTHIYNNDTQVEDSEMPVTGSWFAVEGTEFIFFDGTTNPPMPLKTTADWNYLSQSIHILGLFFMSLAMFISIASGIWVFVMRDNRIVKASQPEFLYLLCAGSAMVAFSLFFISWDEDKGMSEGTLSSFCAVFPWLFVLGYQIMYLALFFKLYRLSKLLSMRRQAIQINQVMIPFAAVIACSVIILGVWQGVDPLTWVREITNPDEEAQFISYAQCDSPEEGVVPFIVPLGIIMGLSVIMTGAISWKLKDVQSELAETKWIFFGIFSHVQVWAIGIPVFIILNDVSRDASYLIFAALIFIFSVTLVILVIWPKIYVWARDTYFGGPPKPKTSISVRKSQTVVSGLDTGSTLGSTTSVNGAADRARAEANARRAIALEAEIEDLKQKHQREKAELATQLEDLRAQQSGAVIEAEVRHAAGAASSDEDSAPRSSFDVPEPPEERPSQGIDETVDC